MKLVKSLVISDAARRTIFRSIIRSIDDGARDTCLQHFMRLGDEMRQRKC